MKTLALIAAGLTIAHVPARADQPGQDWISIGQAERVLHREGYRLIEIEPKDDHWEGEATRHGRTWDFRMSPKTGRIIAMEPDTD